MTTQFGASPVATRFSGDPAGSTRPLVSVVMPVFNGRVFLPETFEAVDRQSYPNVERIAVDDGSADGSVGAIQRHGGWTLRSLDRGGSNRARCEALTAARGDFIAFLDQDDLWHPDHLACCVAALEQHVDLPAAVGRRQRFRQAGELRLSGSASEAVQYDPWRLFPFQVIDTPSMVVVRRSALDAIGGWPQEGGAAADCLAWWRLARLGVFAVIAARTVGVRESGGSMSIVDRRAPRECLENMRRVAIEATRSLPDAERDTRAMQAVGLLDGLTRVVAAVESQQGLDSAALHMEAVLTGHSDAIVLLAARFLGWLLGPTLQHSAAPLHQTLLDSIVRRWPPAAPRTRRDMRRLAATATHTADLLAYLRSNPGCVAGWHCLGENVLARLVGRCGRVADPFDIRCGGSGLPTVRP
jgi:hypothetical protein